MSSKGMRLRGNAESAQLTVPKAEPPAYRFLNSVSQLRRSRLSGGLHLYPPFTRENERPASGRTPLPSSNCSKARVIAA